MADKYKVRKYVTEKGYENTLIPLLNHYDSADDIIFDTLPEKFALKMNFGAGMNIICLDKSKRRSKNASNNLQNGLRSRIIVIQNNTIQR